MGNISSRTGDEGNALYLKDQSRFSIAALQITNSRRRVLLNLTPNAFPASRYVAKKGIGDDSVVDYIQDPESSSSGPPSFLLRLNNDDELNFTFTFVARQGRPPGSDSADNPVDTVINGLTLVFAPTPKDIDNLVTREFHADPNLHKNSNVQLVGDTGDYSTDGSQSVQFQWTWKWKPPKPAEDRGGGWRNCCSFVEYNQRAHRLDTLATFSFWVHNTAKVLASPKLPSPRLEAGATMKLRVPSSQSIESRISDSDGADGKEILPQSPTAESPPEYGLGLATTMTNSTLVPVKVDVACQRPGEDVSAVDDGPLFRATMKSMEQKNSNMRARWKKVLKRAEFAFEAQRTCNEAIAGLMEALRETSSSNGNSVQPAIDHYFDKIAKEILAYERQNTANIHKMIIEPITKLYNMDIKQAEVKKKDFEDESREYYAYVGKYLGQRSDSMKDKKRAETDTKYQNKRRNFELKRFDYSSFMQDLHGGRKDQEVLSHLTRFADAQAKGYLAAAKKIDTLLPQLEALTYEVKEVDKEFQMQRTEREEKRRALEKSNSLTEHEKSARSIPPTTPGGGGTRLGAGNASEARNTNNGTRPQANGSNALSPSLPSLSSSAPADIVTPGRTPSGANKFKGIRDLEEKDHSATVANIPADMHHRKEGLLWALSRPGSHVDPKGLNKQAWHKFWIVLDQGKISEYTNWKQKLDLHMDPIDLRMASVREARNADRRFCFEVITPHFTRVYQGTSEDDMKSWIAAVNSAIQSAVEGKGFEPVSSNSSSGSKGRDIASVLTGKSTSLSNRNSSHSNNKVGRFATVGDKPSYKSEGGENPARILQQIRDADAGNNYCADCGSSEKVEWVSINLGIVICIECSGIHRSLGTHISKVRSLTLDPNAFTIDVVEILLTVGNRVSNMVWEAKLDRNLKPSPIANREQRLKFITAKYTDRLYVQGISSSFSHYSTPDETLLASIKKNDIQNVLYALALHANPNATDRSRNTHSVFLALAAADPAMPASASIVSPTGSPSGRTASISTFPSASATTATRKPFAVAELLLLNSADLPNQPAPIPLSPSAKFYLEQKAAAKAGRLAPSAPAPSPNPATGGMTGGMVVPAVPAGRPSAEGDMLTALPDIRAGNGTSPGERARERERLQKRSSQGARLVKAGYGNPGP
ncbi:ArfGap-domain-containing protein [Aulographum hederae CBS 113979]|uniref:ADP-ribosylation factor GTPase-activating protein n=1 Tax=Aulographum hederae CBS 113979 TaxID=1176131 RepID=A0A6G1GUL9_9PEZI|nr:ArfGap-domain-containing protein [Aulographum hederae CBS 113979]